MINEQKPRELSPQEAKLIRMVDVLKRDLADKIAENAELRVLFDDAMAHNQQLQQEQADREDEGGRPDPEAAGGE